MLKDIVNLTDDEQVIVGVFMNGPTDAEIEAMIPLPRPSLTNWSQEESDAYNAVKRSLKREVFSAAEKAFVEYYLDDSVETIFHNVESEPAPCFWLVLPKGRIAELATLDVVKRIGKPSESEPLTKLTADDPAARQKIAAPLRDYLEDAPENERIPIRLWLRGGTGEEIGNLIPVDYPDLTSSESEVRAYLSAREETIRAYRNNRVQYFVQNRLDEEDEVLFQGAQTQSLVVVVPKARIAALTELQIVSQIEPAFGYDEQFPDPELPEDPDTCNKLDAYVQELMTITAHDERIPVSLRLQTPQNPIIGECVENVLDETDEILGSLTYSNVIQVLVPKYKIAALAALDEVASIGWAIDYNAPVYATSGSQATDTQPLKKDPAVYEKVSPYLLGHMENLPNDAGIPVGIIFQGPSEEEVEALIAETYSGEKDTPAYRTAKKRAQQRLNSAITSAFVEEYLDESDTLYYQGYILCVTAMVPKSKILTIAALVEVTHIDLVAENDAPLESTVGSGVEYGQPCAHDYVTVVTAPTCTEAGFTTFICSKCSESYTGDEVAALGHNWDDGVVTKEATEAEQGERIFTCARCGETKTEAIPVKPHVHAYTDTVSAPTCTEAGFTTHTCACGDSYTDREIAALGHDFKDVICTRCGAADPDYKPPIDDTALRAAIEAAQKLDPSDYMDATAEALEKAIKAARDALDAETQAEIDAAKAALDAAVAALEEKFEENFYFDDVKDPRQYYFEPVYWALQNLITKGTSFTTFSPDDGCTRAQVVTFLWRAAGEPVPTKTENPFKDVKETDYFYKAVLWAVEKGITKGTSADKFSPDATCTRAQIVTFLYRAKGTPEIAKKSKPFRDVADGQYYADAVAWAVENEITTGKSAETFAPDAACTRGEVVTFLYRAAK